MRRDIDRLPQSIHTFEFLEFGPPRDTHPFHYAAELSDPAIQGASTHPRVQAQLQQFWQDGIGGPS